MRKERTQRTIPVAVLAALTLALTATVASAASRPVPAVTAPPLAGGRAGDGHRFATWTGYEVGTNPAAVAAADFDGDGLTDVAFARHYFLNNTIAVQRGIGGGTLGGVKSYPSQDETAVIAAADLNGDTHPDLVALSEGNSDRGNVIDVYMNQGNGTFAHSTAAGGDAPSALAFADLNGDGHLDLAVANNSYNDQGTTVGVLFGKGTGGFGAEKTYTVGLGVYGIAAADLDGDGLIDLAVGQATGAEDAYHIVLLRNKGAGAFSVRAGVTIPGITERWPIEPVVSAADVNGDGKVDLVAGAKLDDQVAILANKGGYSFDQTLLQASWGAAQLIATDVGGDGHPDIVEAAPYGGTQSTGELAFLRGKGDGTFAGVILINQGAQPTGVAVADFDGDGRLDLAVANEGSGTGSIDLQLPNGRFPAAPVYQAVQGLLPLDSASADFDGDGKIDIAVDEIDLFSSGHDRVAIMQNRGGGHMRLVGSLPSGTDSNPKAVIAADLSGDGHPDLAWTPETVGGYPYEVVVALNQGNGQFADPVSYTLKSCGTGHVSAIDVNDDKALDLVVDNNRGGPDEFCEKASRELLILLNNGDGTFQPDYPVELGSLNEMAVGADFTGDGILDLFATDAISYLVPGTGNGQFGQAVSFSARGNEAAVGDFNADGRPDVATADGSFQNMYVMLNTGNGTFSTKMYPGEKINGYLTGNAIAVADLDGDGHLDIAVSDFQGQDVGVYYGQARGAFRPQIRYGAQYDLSDVNLADYDGDGHPDIGGPAGRGGFPIGKTGATTVRNLTL